MEVKKVSDKSLLEDLNIEHSSNKWISKVSIKDTIKYINIIKEHEKFLINRKIKKREDLGPILSIAVRNGREVDLFRLALNNPLITKIVSFFEIKRLGFRTVLLSFLEAFSRSSLVNINNFSSIGQEINIKAKRVDIEIGSFDEMPKSWENKFNIVYFNSLDHSFDPYITCNEIKRVIRPGGYVIIAFAYGQNSTELDPVSSVDFNDIKKLFGPDIIYYTSNGSKWYYREYIVRIK